MNDKHYQTTKQDSENEPPPSDEEAPLADKAPQNDETASNTPTEPSKAHNRCESKRPSMNGSLSRSIRIGKIYKPHGNAIQMSASAHTRHRRKPSDGRPHATDEEEATWGDVGTACCCHSASEWAKLGLFFAALLGLLYVFLVGLDLLSTAFKVVGGCTAGSLLGSDTNPLASVMIGIIATTLLQSSSTTTAIIVSLVSGGLDVEQGIYMVFGCNVGTSVTSMLVSLAHMGSGEELERAFSGSSVLYFFNLLTLIILLPLEITTHYLYELTKPMLPSSVGSGDSWEGPVKKIVSPLVKKIIVANKDLIEEISLGEEIDSCSEVYPVNCIGGEETYDACHNENATVGVIACDKDSGKCPAFFQDGASKQDDMVSGWVCFVIAITILVFCLVGLVTLLRKMLLGASTSIIYKATSINPYLAMLVGCGVTILVQSSSITTSALVPLAGVGVLDLEAMYPLVLGADIGTTFTALLSAMVSSDIGSLQIALVHLFFNLTGLVIWYPVPFMRRVVLKFAQLLGTATRHWRAFPILFIAVMFFLIPLLLLGISSCFEKQTKGFTALGVFLLLLLAGFLGYFVFWWSCRDGKKSCQSCIRRRQRRAAATTALADDMDYLKVDTEWCKNEIGRLKDFAGLLEARVEDGTLVVRPRPEEGPSTGTREDEDRLSAYESCRSRPWKDILFLAGGSIKSSIGGSQRNEQTVNYETN